MARAESRRDEQFHGTSSALEPVRECRLAHGIAQLGGCHADHLGRHRFRDISGAGIEPEPAQFILVRERRRRLGPSLSDRREPPDWQDPLAAAHRAREPHRQQAKHGLPVSRDRWRARMGDERKRRTALLRFRRQPDLVARFSGRIRQDWRPIRIRFVPPSAPRRPVRPEPAGHVHGRSLVRAGGRCCIRQDAVESGPGDRCRARDA